MLDDFTRGYIECALWTSNDESTPDGGLPMDRNYSIEDFDWGTLCRFILDCQSFLDSDAWRAAVAGEDPRTDSRASHGYSLEASAGHDFWLTQSGHGAGFWDGDWKSPHDDSLTEESKRFAEVNLEIGDNGQIYSF